MMKPSHYNHFQRWTDDYYIAYNAQSGAVAVMTPENYDMYQVLGKKLQNTDEKNLTPQEQELVKQLKYGSFIHPVESDELYGLKLRHNIGRYDQTALGLIIAPTMACNMACQYCFEDNKKGKMPSEIIETILTFVENRAKRVDRVSVSWYGGEPLLAMDVIEDITTSLLDMGKQYNFEYSAGMTSNGYLLTKENVDCLKEYKVASVQVTLDGPARYHDVKRPLKNGKSSFDTIVNNLSYAITQIGIGIRVNVDKSFTKEMIEELLGELKKAGLSEKVGIYFGQLEASTKVCSNIAENCYDTADFSKVEIDFYRLLLENGFRIERLPSPAITICMAQNINSLLIDPEGNVYRCFNYVGDTTRSIGNIRNEINFEHPNFVSLFRFDPFADDTCRECNILPVCLGGCPARRSDRGLRKEQLCESWKHNLQPMLEIIARSRQQKISSARKEK